MHKVEDLLKQKEEQGEVLLRKINELDQEINTKTEMISSIKAKNKKTINQFRAT